MEHDSFFGQVSHWHICCADNKYQSTYFPQKYREQTFTKCVGKSTNPSFIGIRMQTVFAPTALLVVCTSYMNSAISLEKSLGIVRLCKFVLSNADAIVFDSDGLPSACLVPILRDRIANFSEERGQYTLPTMSLCVAAE